MFWHINNIIKNNLKLKIYKFKIKLNANDLSLIKQFMNLNLIKIIKKEQNNFYLIVLNEKNKINYIINLYKPSQKKTITLKNIKKISLKKHNLLILSTSKGIITNVSCLNLKIGGLLLTNILL